MPTTTPTDLAARAADVSGDPHIDQLVRIQEASRRTGLTPRAIRYYEEQGLLAPGRSDGSYRLYSPVDIERLRTIRTLRDDGGCSIAEVVELLEDDADRDRAVASWSSARDRAEQRVIAQERLVRLERRIALLDGRISRLQALVIDARTRRERVLRALDELGVDR